MKHEFSIRRFRRFPQKAKESSGDKCIIRSSRAAADIRAAAGFGVHATDAVEVDFPAVNIQAS